ncbi:MAG: Mur ligase family protein [Planctomycetota bacterium]
MSGPPPIPPLESEADVMAWLASFTDFEQKQAHLLGRKSLDLSRMRNYCADLGSPERGVPVAHVAGSKGKGSTSIILRHLVSAHDRRCGLFLSPHLVHVRERISIDGVPIPPDRFVARARRLAEVAAARTRRDPADLPSFFESMALMGFLEFAAEAPDLAVIEVGLGGRLDATNVVHPDVTVVTRLDLEHTRVLGDTLDEIAAEKAGILKPGVPLVTSALPDEEGGRIVHRLAAERGVPVDALGREIRVERDLDDPAPNPRFSLEIRGRRFEDLRLGSPGAHQIENAALAIAAALRLEESGGPRLDGDRVRAGLAALALPGRLERLRADEPSWSGPVLIDSAHTPRSTAALAAALDGVAPERPRVLVAGFLRDKDVVACLAPLRGRFDAVIACPPVSPRALPADELLGAMRTALGPEGAAARAAPDLESVFARLGALEAGIAVVTGSVYLAGAVRARLTGGAEARGI